MRLIGKLQTEVMRERRAFTLIELLVVIGVIALLMSILLPVLARAKESGRRCVCSNHVRQFVVGIQLYANDNKDRLPSGLSDNGNPQDEHTPILSRAVRNALVDLIGSDRRSWRQFDYCFDRLSPLFVLDTNHTHSGYFGQTLKYMLNLGRVDVFTA